MAGNEFESSADQIKEAKKQAERARQELKESQYRLGHAELPALLKALWNLMNHSEDTAEVERVFKHGISVFERMEENRAKQVTLNKWFMRHEWQQAQNFPQRMLTIRKWAPYQLRRRFQDKSLYKIAVALQRTLIKLSRMK